MITDIFI